MAKKTRDQLKAEAEQKLGVIVPADWTKAQIQSAIDAFDTAPSLTGVVEPSTEFVWDPWKGPDQGWSPASPVG